MLDGMSRSRRAPPRDGRDPERPARPRLGRNLFAGVAPTGLCNPFLAYWCAIAALLTAYVGCWPSGSARGVSSVEMSKPGAWSRCTRRLDHVGPDLAGPW